MGVGCRSSVPPLANTEPSAMALAGAVLKALEAKDANRLAALALNEPEFRDHVWPELPAARPERNLPFSYVWLELRQKSDASLSRLIQSVGGRQFDLVSISFSSGTTPYGSYLVHRKAVLTVKDASGAERQLQAFGSVLEKAGRFKVFSYVIDD